MFSPFHGASRVASLNVNEQMNARGPCIFIGLCLTLIQQFPESNPSTNYPGKWFSSHVNADDHFSLIHLMNSYNHFRK
jgi:hypothetical protein